MLRIYWPLPWRDDIADFGVLINVTQEDKDAHLAFTNGDYPITLVADNFSRENVLRMLSRLLEEECNRFEKRTERIMMQEEQDLSSVEEKILNSNKILFARILDAAVVCNARGNTCKPDYDEFRKIMAQIIAKITYEPLKRTYVQLARSESALREAKIELQRNRADSLNLKREFNILNKELALAIKDNVHNVGLINQAVSTINDLESTQDSLNERVCHQERLLQNAETEIKKNEQALQVEKEKCAREKLEKTNLSARVEQEIKQIAENATQRHQFVSDAISQLRKQISPLRRELSPLRRQVKAQELELRQKDAEIARLKEALQSAQFQSGSSH